jgi:signal transduction histidine kinase
VPHSRRKFSVPDRWFNRLVIGAVTVGFLLLIAIGISATSTSLLNRDQTEWVNHTYQVEREISQVRVLLERAEAARRGLLLSDDPHIPQTYLAASRSILPALRRLQALTRDNPMQQENIRRAMLLVRQNLVLMEQSYILVAAGRRDEAIDAFRVTRVAGLARSSRAVAEAMLAEENRLLNERMTVQAAGLRRFFVTLLVAGILLVIVAVATVWVIIRYTQDLTRSQDALRALNANLEGAVRERTADLQRANEEIQRFAYIVSHDLRSPLVNVMGFTSELESAARRLGAMMDRVERDAPALVDADSRTAAHEDLPEAITFIRTSTEKMDRLINAILRLSREGRRPITPEPLDSNALVAAVVGTLKHRIDDLGIEMVIQPDLPALVSDRLAIEQIIGNIVENAIKYLRRGVPGRIEIGAHRAGGRVMFTIADNGRGIDPRDHDRIFDLFRRSGAQDQPGEGIGLAHTRALAYRLGGTIGVESELGKGATFTINLPAVFTGELGSSA